MVEVREVSSSDEVRFKQWHGALAAGALDGRAAASVSSLREFTDSLGSPSPVKSRTAVAAFRGGECVGAMLFEVPLQSNHDTVMVEIDVPPEHRGHGVGSALWEWAEERARQQGRSIFQTEVNVPSDHTVDTWPGARFAAARGFMSANVEDHLVVSLPFDQKRLAALEARTTNEDGYRVGSWTGRCPDAYVQAWAELHSAMSVDVPTGELTREAAVHTIASVRLTEERMAQNWVTLNSLAFAEDGEPVGYSKMFLPKTRPDHAHQDDTLVLLGHRGHNLGLRLKVATLRALECLPSADSASRQWLHTYTEQDNAPMQAVNAHFGFYRVEAMHEFERQG